MKPLLHVQDLRVSFSGEQGETEALRGVSFSLRRGEVLAVVGESGSGKSVTALSVLGLLPSPPARVKSGRILFSPDGSGEADLLGVDAQEIRRIRGGRISMVFQEPMTSLNPVLTCGEQVAEVLRRHEGLGRREARERTAALFADVRLPDPSGIHDRYPHQLSGGQKQRVMIAMATACRPELLIADEPTTALDVTVQKAILSLIRDLQRERGMGVMFITHDLGLVAETADRVIVMYKGGIVEEGAVADVLRAPAHPYTKALLACRPALHTRKARLPVVADFLPEVDRPKPAQPTPGSAAPERTPAAGSVLMQVRDLTVEFAGGRRDRVRAVDGVSFDILQGETLGLVGESGCGKTTLGRAILGLLPPASGSIRYDGRELLSLKASEWKRMRQEVQIVFQDPYGSLNPRMTVGQAIAEPLLVHGLAGDRRQRHERSVELLGKVGLPPAHHHRYPHAFSGGQRQRIGIARALALGPRLIVFDESVSALDASVQAQVLNLLADLKRDMGFTALFISHDLSVVNHISDRILVMRGGRIVESGAAEEVFSRPKEEYTRELLAAVPGGWSPA